MTDAAHTNAIKEQTRAIKDHTRAVLDLTRLLKRIANNTEKPEPSTRIFEAPENKSPEEVYQQTKDQLAAMEPVLKDPVEEATGDATCKCLVVEGFVTDPYTQKKSPHITRTYRRECEVHTS